MAGSSRGRKADIPQSHQEFFLLTLMRYYPVFLDIAGRHCVVVGGGRVAERKAASLVSAGAEVIVISPAFTKGLKGLTNKISSSSYPSPFRGEGRVGVGGLKLIRRNYKTGDLKGAYLTIAASASKAVNKRVHNEASERNVLINVVDSPDICSFIVPSVVERGSIVIAISTSGKAPALARVIRKELEKIIGPEYEVFLEIIAKVRAGLKARGKKAGGEKIIKALAVSPVLRWLKGGDTDKVKDYLSRMLGFAKRITPSR
ncbi:MAG: bifunctional precorrin-2 dehydrogenase/sirohydrochlorin ferrochelatase [Deltaproteobacteria bacterium]|nr:bifunctional precorrin-2 dehydrogenase/sirohydrochlorin ferrochelatase [Deltaproteobacteria bacterium]